MPRRYPRREFHARPVRSFGRPDYLLWIAVADLDAYERLLMDHLAGLPGIARTNSQFTIKTIKGIGAEQRSHVRAAGGHRAEPVLDLCNVRPAAPQRGYTIRNGNGSPGAVADASEPSSSGSRGIGHRA
jgi:Lrp/AsnC ligand binding domain